MRSWGILLWLASAHADTSIPIANDFDLVERGCALLHYRMLSKSLLEKLGALDIRNGKDGWHGSLSHSRFKLLTAFGNYDDAAVSNMLIFELPRRARLAKKEVSRFSSAPCEVHYRPPGDFGDPNWPGNLTVMAR